MALSEAARERRRNYVGASDVAAVMGVSPFASAADVWAEKVHGTTDLSSDAAELGSALEAGVRAMADAKLGPTKKQAPFRVLEGTRLGVTLDAYLEGSGGDAIVPVEIKTAGLLNPHSPFLSEWGAEYTDEVPAHYLLQVMAQIAATGASHGWIGALIAGRGFSVYRINRDDELIGIMLESIAGFWRSVEARERPSDSVASVEVLARIVRRPGSVAPMPDAMLEDVVRWRYAAAAARAADKAADAAKARVIAWLDDCEAAALDADALPADVAEALVAVEPNVKPETLAGRVAVTYLEQKRSGVDLEAVERDHPGLLARYRRDSVFRVLRHAKLPKGSVIDPSLSLSAPADSAAALPDPNGGAS